jgi:hypothetical protein
VILGIVAYFPDRSRLLQQLPWPSCGAAETFPSSIHDDLGFNCGAADSGTCSYRCCVMEGLFGCILQPESADESISSDLVLSRAGFVGYRVFSALIGTLLAILTGRRIKATGSTVSLGPVGGAVLWFVQLDPLKNEVRLYC